MTNHKRPAGPRVAAYQLPPKWDGRVVEWRAWTATAGIVMCPPPRQPCEACGSQDWPVMNTGIVYPLQGDTVTEPVYKRTAPKPNGRPGAIYLAGEGTVAARPVVRLVAFRCPKCGLDTVWDQQTDEWWTLDEADYGPDGSTDPRLF